MASKFPPFFVFFFRPFILMRLGKGGEAAGRFRLEVAWWLPFPLDKQREKRGKEQGGRRRGGDAALVCVSTETKNPKKRKSKDTDPNAVLLSLLVRFLSYLFPSDPVKPKGPVRHPASFLPPPFPSPLPVTNPIPTPTPPTPTNPLFVYMFPSCCAVADTSFRSLVASSADSVLCNTFPLASLCVSYIVYT